MATAWGKIINKIGYGTIYNDSWVGQYPFVSIVGDANDLYKRVSDASGTMEAQECLVETFNKTVQ